MGPTDRKTYEAAVTASREARMAWWHEARYGMFVHWGLYAQLGRNEWVQAIECIPQEEYSQLAASFKPKPTPAREWAALAKAAGMTYMVLTTKHHEGFCLWDTQQTDYNAVRRGPGRDLVQEYVDACREYGLRIGFYYSLMDWHHPDGARAHYDPDARRRFLDFTQGCVRELLTQYGKIDILWYDVALPFQHHEGWESLALNQMARELQPDLLINDRSRLPEDFSTPEEHITAAEAGRGWEACMTFNQTSWGYMPSAAADSYTPRGILKMLGKAAGGAGNLLLNIGPAPDGSVPEEVVTPLTTVGQWLEQHGEAVYGSLDRAGIGQSSACGSFSRRGNVLYFWCRHWPGETLQLGGFGPGLKSARLLPDGPELPFKQLDRRLLIQGLPATCPDPLAGVPVLRLEFAGAPDHRQFTTCPALWIA